MASARDMGTAVQKRSMGIVMKVMGIATKVMDIVTKVMGIATKVMGIAMKVMDKVMKVTAMFMDSMVTMQGSLCMVSMDMVLEWLHMVSMDTVSCLLVHTQLRVHGRPPVRLCSLTSALGWGRVPPLRLRIQNLKD